MIPAAPSPLSPSTRPSGSVTQAAVGEVFSRLVAWSLPVTYFLVTVSFYLRTYDSAQIKITFAQVGCSLVLLAWALQLIFQRRWPFSIKDLPLVAPFLAVLASGIISFLQSSFQAGSVDEFTRRVFYVSMALIVIAEFRGLDRHRRLMRWLIAAFAVTVFYGFVQYFDGRLFPPGATQQGLDPFIWRQAFGLRVFSTFGNPNFYGNFLVIITPILIALYFKKGGVLFRPYFMVGLLVPVVVLTDKLFTNHFGGVTASNQAWVTAGLLGTLLLVAGLVWWRSASASASGMLIFLAATFVNLYATETKGAWIGFIVAVVASAFLAGLFLVGPKARRLTYGVMGISLAIALAGFFVVRHYAQQRKQSVDFRVFTWIATWDMIRSQPILGTGIGSFKWAYPAYRRPEIILLEGRSNTETDHAEDEYLEVLFDEGLLGLGVFLWLILSVSVMGLRMLNRLTVEGPRPPPAPAFDERVYKIMGYLGAWWGALIHWFMDVSIRFVSSGIFSFFLPALVTSFVRNNPMPAQQDRSHPMDLWVRMGTALFWMAFFLFPDRDFQPLADPSNILLVGAFLLVIGEILEFRLSPDTPPFSRPPILLAATLLGTAEILELPGIRVEGLTALHLLRILAGLFLLGLWFILPKSSIRSAAGATPLSGRAPSGLQFGLAAAAVVLWFWTNSLWRGQFLADVSHNAGIFFSKQNIWMRSPEFDDRVKVPGYPEAMREAYHRVGGALEHYEKTAKLNAGFPMARYFVGNVYNDWGSSVLESSRQARQKGDVQTAEVLLNRAKETWRKSLDAYDKVKAFAPNYVQTHHQVGLVYLKLGEMESAFGSKEKADEYWREALNHFKLYQTLDPVFPLNYYRQSYIHFMQGDMAKAEEAYQGALVYNSTNVVGRVYAERNVETYSNLGRLFYVQLVNRFPGRITLPKDSELFRKSEDYYQKALDWLAKSARPETAGVEPAKALAVLYNRVGENEKSKALWYQIRAWNPEDPDVKRVFTPPTPVR